MNTYITLACLLAVASSAYGSGYGYGGYGGYGYAPIYAPAAVSTQNVYKEAPIPIIKSVVAPIVIKEPIIKEVIAPVIKTIPIAVNYGGYGGYGGYYDGLYGGYGLGKGLGYGLGYGKV